jgi:hypothetical protein
MDIFQQLVEPSLDVLEGLLLPGKYCVSGVSIILNVEQVNFATPFGETTSAGTDILLFSFLFVGSNVILRHISFVRDAFAGTPTLGKENVTPQDIASWHDTSDIMSVLSLHTAAIILTRLAGTKSRR